MRLSRNQIAIINASLHAIAGEKEGKALFKFSPKITWNLVKNLRITTALVEDLESVRNKLIKEVSEGKERLEPGTPEHTAFLNKWTAFIAEEEEVSGLLALTEEDLNLEVNEIPIGVLTGLTHLLK